jgi:phosphatidylglycerol:prolipoprotein diacylglycerol transferase
VTGLLQLLAIEIGVDPSIADVGPFELTWHGVFTAVGIAAGVYLGALLARNRGFTEDDAYSIALVGVPAGIVGARALWVVENYDQIDPWTDVFRINEGGISVYGAVIAGVLAAAVYGWIRKLPVTRGLDVAGFGLLLGMAIGRIGDLINGEHIAKTSDLPWAVVYTHIDSPGYFASVLPSGEQIGRHPATTYEMIGDMLIIGVMALLFVRLWQYRPGITFFAGVVLYSAMRFGVSYLRIDSCGGRDITDAACPEYIVRDWMTFPQVVSLCTFAIGLVGLAWCIRRGPQPVPAGVRADKPAPMPAVAAGRVDV